MTSLLEISVMSHIRNSGKVAGVNPSPAVCCTATAVALSAGKAVRTGDCKAAAAAACWVGRLIPLVHRGAAAVTGCAGLGAVGGPSRVSVL